MATICCQDCGRELKGMLGSFHDEPVCSKCQEFASLHTDPARGYFTGVAGYFDGLRFVATSYNDEDWSDEDEAEEDDYYEDEEDDDLDDDEFHDDVDDWEEEDEDCD